MSQRDIVQLTQTGRRAYYYWPILLMLKQRQLQRKLADANYIEDAVSADASQHPAQHWLQQAGFPMPNDWAERALPALPPLPDGVRFWFRVGAAFDDADVHLLDLIRQLVSGKCERLELLRVPQAQCAYVEHAAERFNAGLELEAVAVIHDAARIWADYHDSVVADWQPISAQFLQQTVAEPVPIATDTPVAFQDSPFSFGKTSFFGGEGDR